MIFPASAVKVGQPIVKNLLNSIALKVNLVDILEEMQDVSDLTPRSSWCIGNISMSLEYFISLAL